MTTTTKTPATETASIALDGDYYVEHGLQGQMFTGTCAQWADTFRALGGLTASVRPGWAFGTDYMVAEVTGSPEAIAFVIGNL